MCDHFITEDELCEIWQNCIDEWINCALEDGLRKYLVLIHDYGIFRIVNDYYVGDGPYDLRELCIGMIMDESIDEVEEWIFKSGA